MGEVLRELYALDTGVLCVLDAGLEVGEERVDAGVDDDEPAEGGRGLQADRSVGVVQRLQERRLQLRQERLQHHPNLQRVNSPLGDHSTLVFCTQRLGKFLQNFL